MQILLVNRGRRSGKPVEERIGPCDRDRRLHVLLLLALLLGGWSRYGTPLEDQTSAPAYLWVVSAETPGGQLHRGRDRTAMAAVLGHDATVAEPVFHDLDGDCGRWPARLTPFAGVQVPVNRADVDTLTSLPGIGPVLAGNIISYRRRHGRIGSAAELSAVQGIGTALARRLAPDLCFE